MGKRDPGNKPGAGDRIPFVYIQTKEKKKLQGDRIEHPQFITENKIRPDYGHYITNQIMKPVQQVFALVLEKIPEFQHKKRAFHNRVKRMRARYINPDTQILDIEKYNKKVQSMRNAEIKELIFQTYVIQCENVKNKQKTLMSYFM